VKPTLWVGFCISRGGDSNRKQELNEQNKMQSQTNSHCEPNFFSLEHCNLNEMNKGGK